MIDFCKWVMACEPALPWESGEFLRVYKASLAESLINIVENDQVAQAVLQYGDFSGTATELLKGFNTYRVNVDKTSKSWPTAANYLSGRLRRVAGALRSVGVTIEWNRKHIKITVPLDPSRDEVKWEGEESKNWGKDINGMSDPNSPPRRSIQSEIPVKIR